MLLDNLLLTSTSAGRMAEWPGIRRRSSKVNPTLKSLCSITTSDSSKNHSEEPYQREEPFSRPKWFRTLLIRASRLII
jgi:hypothetical protein